MYRHETSITYRAYEAVNSIANKVVCCGSLTVKPYRKPQYVYPLLHVYPGAPLYQRVSHLPEYFKLTWIEILYFSLLEQCISTDITVDTNLYNLYNCCLIQRMLTFPPNTHRSSQHLLNIHHAHWQYRTHYWPYSSHTWSLVLALYSRDSDPCPNLCYLTSVFVQILLLTFFCPCSHSTKFTSPCPTPLQLEAWTTGLITCCQTNLLLPYLIQDVLSGEMRSKLNRFSKCKNNNYIKTIAEIIIRKNLSVYVLLRSDFVLPPLNCCRPTI